jgi:hypothetical protein
MSVACNYRDVGEWESSHVSQSSYIKREVEVTNFDLKRLAVMGMLQRSQYTGLPPFLNHLDHLVYS